MIRYEDALLTHYGYLETKGCAQATLCPALSLPDLFSAGHADRLRTPAASADPADHGSLLAAVPTYFSQAVITPDHRDATLAFGIRLMPLSRQQRVIDYMRSQLHPPPGVTAQLAGLPVLAAQANAALSSSGRRLLTLLAGLLAVGLVLLAVFRRARAGPRAADPDRARHRLVGADPVRDRDPAESDVGNARGAGDRDLDRVQRAAVRALPPGARRADTTSRDGARAHLPLHRGAVLASGITAIAGFGVLVLSSITMLRDFGFVTLIDLSVSLGGVLLVLPAVLALAERERRCARSSRAFGRRAARAAAAAAAASPVA